MVQKTFGIYSDDLSGCRLFIEAGTQHMASWFVDTITGSFKAFEFFQFELGDDTTIDQVVRDIKLQSQLMSMQMDAALIIWENSACTAIPEEFFSKEIAGSYMEIIAGEDADTTLLEEHFEKYIILSRYSDAYAAAIQKHLATGSFSHKFSALLKKYSGADRDAKTVVRMVFYPGRFIIIIIKNRVLQIIQCIPYSTAEDVLYSVLHMCSSYGIVLDATPVIVCGLINTGSPLLETLLKYIENVEIEKSPQDVFGAGGFADHPPQYFLPYIQ